MMVQLYATLRPLAGRRKVRLEMDETTVGEVLDELVSRYPNLHDALFDDSGDVRKYVAIMVEGRDIRHLAGLETPVAEDSEMDIFPPVAGGGA